MELSRRTSVEPHFLLKQDRHTTQLAGDVPIANKLRFSRVFAQVIELKARVQIKFPIAPTYRGQCALAAVIEKRFIIFITMNQGLPLTGRIPPTTKRD